jgi:hypothetical protein
LKVWSSFCLRTRVSPKAIPAIPVRDHIQPVNTCGWQLIALGAAAPREPCPDRVLPAGKLVFLLVSRQGNQLFREIRKG